MKIKNKVNAAENLIEKNFPKKKGLIDYLNSDDSRNAELGVRLTKGLCTKIGDDHKKLHEIVASQGWTHQRFGAIREFFTESQIVIIREMIDNKQKKHYFFNRTINLRALFYQKVADKIASHYSNDIRIKGFWQGAKITHTRDIEKFELKLGHHNFATNGVTVYHFSFNFYAFEINFSEIFIPKISSRKEYVHLATPKKWDGKSETIAFCFVVEYFAEHGKKVLHKGILKDGVFHKKNIKSIRKDYLELINKQAK